MLAHKKNPRNEEQWRERNGPHTPSHHLNLLIRRPRNLGLTTHLRYLFHEQLSSPPKPLHPSYNNLITIKMGANKFYK